MLNSVVDFVITHLHRVPRFNFQLKQVQPAFDLVWFGDYLQSLFFLGCICLIFTGLLLLTITIQWICRCCSRKAAGRTRREVRNLSISLFLISALCFVLLGFCFFGNEHLNRGVTSAVAGIDDTIKNIKYANEQCTIFSGVRENATKHINDLISIVNTKAHEHPEINQTDLTEAHHLLTGLSHEVDSLQTGLEKMQKVLQGVDFLEEQRKAVDYYEFERWAVCITLLVIISSVLFLGATFFCQRSWKGSVLFSAFGVVIFILSWSIFSISLPVLTALSDLCLEGDKYVAAHLSREMIETIKFYKTCNPKPSHDNLPPSIPVGQMNSKLLNLQANETKLDALLGSLFNRSSDITNATTFLSYDISQSLKSVGALETTVACYAYHDDVQGMYKGICYTGIIGTLIFTSSLFLLGILFFALLLIVSRSWYLFSRQEALLSDKCPYHRPNPYGKFFTLDRHGCPKRLSLRPTDYGEVDESDPFFPRNNDSTIPADIYGTHVYNPRTRFGNSLERTEPSTGTTTATGGITTGNNNPSTPLLDNSGGPPTPLWNHRSGSNFNAQASAPPATNSVIRSTGLEDAYGRYQEQFDV
uniref:Protein tweety homolog n=1 Tax=Steinernema glaseri TaxID=37863 RepID=A0A1I7ZE36_9BILA